MSSDAGTQQQSVADALARLVEARRGAESVWVEALRELGAVDRAVYEAVADTPTPELDGPSAGSRTQRATRACGLVSQPRSPCSVAGADAARRWRACWRSG